MNHETKYTLLSSFYFFLSCLAWAFAVLLLPINVIGSVACGIIMGILFWSAKKLLPSTSWVDRAIRFVMTALTILGGLLLFFTLSLMLFLSIYGRQFN